MCLARGVRSHGQVFGAVVRRFNITSINGRAADKGACAGGINATARVSEGQASSDIGADEVALHRVSSARAQINAAADVSRDKIARVWRCAANRSEERR